MVNDMKIADIFYMTIEWALLVLIRLILFTMGLFIVPIALPFRITHAGTRQHFTQFNKTKFWELVTLPNWAWLWSNDRDGALGDKRGWWDNECGDARKFSCMFKWLAIRNPVHNTTFTWLSCDVSKVFVSVLGGSLAKDYKDIQDGWQLLKASGHHFNYYHLYIVKPSLGLYVRIGHKIKLKHNVENFSQDPDKRWKKFTFRIRFKK